MSRVERLEYAHPSGWGFNTFCVRLPSGGLFVYSPSAGGLEGTGKLGTPEVLFCPNHVHHMALEKYREKWPAALACASKAALPRLGKQGHPGLRDAAEAPLPEGARLLVAEGINSGETILSLGDEWLVCDAFTNFGKPMTGPIGFGIGALGMKSGQVSVGRLFKWFSVKDAKAYRAWLFDALDREQPKTVHFAHGEPLGGPAVVEKLKAAFEQRFT